MWRQFCCFLSPSSGSEQLTRVNQWKDAPGWHRFLPASNGLLVCSKSAGVIFASRFARQQNLSAPVLSLPSSVSRDAEYRSVLAELVKQLNRLPGFTFTEHEWRVLPVDPEYHQNFAASVAGKR